MSNSHSVSYDTISRFLIEPELGKSTPHTDCTRLILSVNLVVDQGNTPSFSHPSDANWQINFLSDRVDTYLDSSLSASPQQSRTSLSTDLSAAIKNRPQLSVSSVSSIMSGTTNTSTGGGYFVRNTVRTESEVLAKQVVGPKEKRGIPGSRERGIHYLSATSALDPKFGASRHFVPTCREGEPEN